MYSVEEHFCRFSTEMIFEIQRQNFVQTIVIAWYSIRGKIYQDQTKMLTLEAPPGYEKTPLYYYYYYYY